MLPSMLMVMLTSYLYKNYRIGNRVNSSRISKHKSLNYRKLMMLSIKFFVLFMASYGPLRITG